jgi:hypothetical protein
VLVVVNVPSLLFHPGSALVLAIASYRARPSLAAAVEAQIPTPPRTTKRARPFLLSRGRARVRPPRTALARHRARPSLAAAVEAQSPTPPRTTKRTAATSEARPATATPFARQQRQCVRHRSLA